MSGNLQKLKVSAFIAGVLSFGGAAIEKIIETGTEKAGNYWMDRSLSASNAGIAAEHWTKLFSNLSNTYNKAKSDSNYRRKLLKSSGSDEHKDFYVLFALSICPFTDVDQDELKEFRSQQPIAEAINIISSNPEPNLSQAICQNFNNLSLGDEQIKSVLNPPLWDKKFWLEVFGWLFLLCAGVLQVHPKGLSRK